MMKQHIVIKKNPITCFLYMFFPLLLPCTGKLQSPFSSLAHKRFLIKTRNLLIYQLETQNKPLTFMTCRPEIDKTTKTFKALVMHWKKVLTKRENEEYKACFAFWQRKVCTSFRKVSFALLIHITYQN